MFNFLINWDKQVKENIPEALHKPKRFDIIHSMLKPLKVIHAELLQSREDALYKVAYTSQKIPFEIVLNDKFDPVNRGIYIEDKTLFNSNYLFMKVESKPPFYFYRKWRSSINYIAGEFAEESGKVYQAQTNNNNSLPSANPLDWTYYKDMVYFRMKQEYGVSGFTVMVPSSLVYDENRMRALINYYRFASKHYTIETY